VRERNRRQMARIKSRRASASELREAKVRLKELQEEFRALDLRRETKKGETREERYARTLKLRTMREQFEMAHPYDKRPHANSLLLSLVMIVSSFLLCGFVGGGAYVGFRLYTAKPDPVSTANAFWADMKSQQYTDLYVSYFSPTLQLQVKEADFVTTAKQADTDFGFVTDATPSKSQVTADTASLTYRVTRTNQNSGKTKTYEATLALQLINGSWDVGDLGTAADPNQASATPTPTVQPTATAKK